MVAGFVLRLLKDKHPCPDSGKSLIGTETDIVNKLICLQDRGGLLYPSRGFVCLVKLIFDILENSTCNYNVDALLKSWSLTIISELPPDILVCGCNDVEHTAKLRELVIRSLCKIYFTNVSFNCTNIDTQKPKFTQKPSSKKVKKL